ncbi:MAG: hypothetical protein KDF54_01410 [Hydrogenophaga sp.]|nr:hypothetical protein [Hydrogenophaga sp.]
MSHVSPTAHDKDSAPALTWWRALLVLAVAGAWSWAAHVASTRPEPTTWGVLLAVLPMSTAVVVTLWRSDRRWMAMLVLVLLIAVVVSLWPWLMTQVALLFLIEQLGVYALLASFFALSLRGPGESLVTQMARRVHGGELSQALERYTRSVTVAWALFFVVVGLVSVLLFVFASAQVWSGFANLCTGPLIGLMFVGEYLCRRVALAGEPTASLADTIRAWKTHNASKTP